MSERHLTGGQGVASSNLVVPTPLINSKKASIFRGVFITLLNEILFNHIKFIFF